MGRPKGAKNRRTLLREAEADIAHAKDGTEILDCLYVMETGMRYFFKSPGRQECERQRGGGPGEYVGSCVDRRENCALPASSAGGDQGGREGSRAARCKKIVGAIGVQMIKHFERLAPVLDLEAIMEPSDGIANREVTLKRRSRSLLDTSPRRNDDVQQP